MVFDNLFLSALFGLAGTIILFSSPIVSWLLKMRTKEYFVISQMFGFLFLINSFLYLLFPTLTNNKNLLSYVCFLGLMVYVSLFWIRENETRYTFFDIKTKKHINKNSRKTCLIPRGSENFALAILCLSGGLPFWVFITNSDWLPSVDVLIFFLLGMKHKEGIINYFNKLNSKEIK
ncbi:MAG: hypothetical protein KJ949_03210 [Nanoarchaeota archaeon]|nr:hypothetical protein [Nanoarchaeota archaeon]